MGPTNRHLNAAGVVWMIIDGGDTQTLLAGKFFLTFMHSRVVGTQKHYNFLQCWYPIQATW